MAIQVGQTLGNYKLIRQLGSGAFGEVYLGENIHIGTHVAIKVLQGKFSPQDVQDFEEEARKIAALAHPHIVRLLDFGKLDLGGGNKIPFMVMDYAANGTLEGRHPTGTGSQVPLATVVSYVKQIAEALQYAHDKKVIHRDIKPANIFVGRNSEILVGDFGIAVIAHSTQTMQLQVPLGMPAYAAPEQFQGLARPASDQYALGVMVCEWLSGMFPPFPLPIKISAISPAVEQVVFKALEKDPKQRYPRIQDFADALEKVSNPPLPQPAALPQNQPLQVPDLDALYKEFVIAQAANDLELAATRGQELLRYDPNYKNGTFAPQVQRVLQRLHPLRVERHRQQAMLANKAGVWDQEIDAWREVLKLEPRDFQADERLPIAEHNQRYAWMYENAHQLVKNGMVDAAKIVLQELWMNAPYYSDPAALAKKAGLRVPPSYEKAKTIIARKTNRIARETSRSRVISELGDYPPLIYFCILCLVGGLGSAVGMWSQSWLWAIVVVSLTALLSYVVAYRKVVNVSIMLCIAAISGVIAFGCAWYASTLHYDQSQIVHVWLLGARKVVLAEQLYFGIVLSLLCSFCTWVVLEHNGGLVSLVSIAGALVAFSFLILWLLLMLLGTIFGWGFGFGFGWEFSLITGLLLTVVNSIGSVGLLVLILSPDHSPRTPPRRTLYK